MSEHSAAPWSVTQNGHGQPYAWIEDGAEHDAVARVVLERDDLTGYIPDLDKIVDDPRALANARLIAAAPDLLAACEEALYGKDTDEAIDALRIRLRTAIAKARGEEPR